MVRKTLSEVSFDIRRFKATQPDSIGTKSLTPEVSMNPSLGGNMRLAQVNGGLSVSQSVGSGPLRLLTGVSNVARLHLVLITVGKRDVSRLCDLPRAHVSSSIAKQ